jgi:hypothetical protein
MRSSCPSCWVSADTRRMPGDRPVDGALSFEGSVHRGDAFRAVYTVRFEKAVYVLHCFQKKSPSGVRTAQQDVDLIHERLRTAQRDYEVRYAREKD